MAASDLRSEIQRLLSAGRPLEAAAALETLWRAEPTAGTARYLLKQFQAIGGELSLTPYKVQIVRSFTVEPLVPLLRAEAYVSGIDLSVRIGEFNVWAQEIYDAKSPLYQEKPDAVILALEEPEPADLLGALDFFRRHSDAAVIVHNRVVPASPGRGVFDAQSEDLDGYPLPGRSAYVTLTAAFGGSSPRQRTDSP